MKCPVFTAVKVYVVVLWVIAPCCMLYRYQDFGGAKCLHLQNGKQKLLPNIEMEALCSYRNIVNHTGQHNGVVALKIVM
jgi:hypothetical protein